MRWQGTTGSDLQLTITVSGSNDGTNFTQVYTQMRQTWGNLLAETVNLGTTKYRYWKVVYSANGYAAGSIRGGYTLIPEASW